MYSLYLFDLDGTLINSLEDLADACNFRNPVFPPTALTSTAIL